MQGHFGVYAGDYLVGGYDFVQLPAVAVAHVHVLYEPHDVSGAFEIAGQVRDGVVVDPALHHGVYLDGRQAHVGGPLDGVEDAAGAEAPSVHLLEHFVVDAVQAHGDTVQSGILKVLGLLGQQVAVGGEGDVGDAVNCGNLGNQPRKVSAQQRLAAGDAGLGDPEPGEEPGQPRDFLEGQDFLARQELVCLAEYLSGHTIRATEVAAVGHRDAQVSHRPAHCVNCVQRHRHLNWETGRFRQIRRRYGLERSWRDRRRSPGG